MLSPTIADVQPIRITSQIWSLPELASTAARTSAVSPGDGIPIDSSPMIAGSRYPRLLETLMIAPIPSITHSLALASRGRPRLAQHGQQRQACRQRPTPRQPTRLEP